ncbi:hypothetical protein [Chromobacterium subtsugae]|uniref:hypothetical protein n=1 Tax=Chromobacterium subtsugae TaxID=251747 RepID=UPI000640D75C|nr:hypothetical protein [Chromobacterium subtsugae]
MERERILARLPQVQISTEVPDADFRQKLGNDPVLNLSLTGVHQGRRRRMSAAGGLQRKLLLVVRLDQVARPELA